MTSGSLIGRGYELQVLRTAAAEPSHLILVAGEAGAGKTRLTQAFLAEAVAQGKTTLLARCDPLPEPFPFAPVLELIKGMNPARRSLSAQSALLGSLVPLLPEWTESVPTAHEQPEEAGAIWHLRFRALIELWRGLGPTVCVLEDVHWADRQTAEFIVYASHELPEDFTLVVTFRPEDLSISSPLRGVFEVGPPAPTFLEVRPWESAEVHAYLAAAFGRDDIPATFAEYIVEQTSGVPLAVEGLVGLLKDREPRVENQPFWEATELGVPTPVGRAIHERLHRLESDAHGIVEAAAVVGIPSDEAMLATVAGLRKRQALRRLCQALDTGLLVERGRGRYALRNALAVQAVRDAIPPPTRLRMHLRAAEFLRVHDPDALQRLAYHYREGGADQRWVTYAERAADQASAMLDHESAIKTLHNVLAGADMARVVRNRLGCKLALAAIRSQARHEEVVELLGRLGDDHLVQRTDRGRLLYLLAVLLQGHGEGMSARTLLLRSAQLIGRNRAALGAFVMAELSSPWSLEGAAQDHLRWSERAVARSESAADRCAMVGSQSTRAGLLISLGDGSGWAAARAIPSQARNYEEAIALILSDVSLAWSGFHVGHYRRSRRFLDRAARRVEAIGYTDYQEAIDATLATLHWATGQWREFDVVGTARAEAVTRDGLSYWVSVRLAAALLDIWRGHVRRAEGRLSSSLQEAERSGLIAWRIAAGGGLARLALDRGDVDGACSRAMEAVDLVARKGIWPWLADVAPVAIEALLAGQRKGEAQSLVNRMDSQLDGRDAPLAEAALNVCHGLLLRADGDTHAAARAALLAAAAYQRLPRPYEAACSIILAGDASCEGGDRERGAQLLVRAWHQFTRLGATGNLETLDLDMRRWSISRPGAPSRGRKPYGPALSPRERDVAELAAQGKTNAEIAQILFLSSWTVKEHLGKAMRKLGVQSRTMLASRWVRG